LPVLTVTGLSNAEYLISSVALGIDEYYAGVGESPGVWTGHWAKALGLAGVVEADALRRLVDGQHPGTGVDLLAGSKPRKVLAFDLTFSAPKSVSLLWALGSESTADVVVAAHREAVAVALDFLEERAAVARLQSGGVRRRTGTRGWAVAGFVHRTSREGDPQLHTHCLVPNLVQRCEDGRIVAFDGAPLFEWARAAGSIYQNHLQRLLIGRLGVEWGTDVHNTREIDGFERSQLRAFSKRSVQIEAELEAKGAIYDSPALRMTADDEASLATRTVKDHSLTPKLLVGRWLAEAEQAGLDTGAELARAVCDRHVVVEALGWDEIAAALVDAENGLCARSARFTRADVVEYICALSAGRLSTGEITALADRFVASELAVRLTPDTEAGGRKAAQWSTATHRAREDRTLALMDGLAARPAAPVAVEAVEAALAAAPELGADQVAAIRMLAGDGGSVRAVLSPAGFGKTTMLHTAARAATTDGLAVVAVATTAKAVSELAGAGLEARTIARLRIDLADGPLAARTVVVLDEISQTPTAELEAVLAAVDACPGGQVWVLGDPRQSQPVGAGGGAVHIETMAADGVIPAARLTVNRRQIDAADRHALDLLRVGNPDESQKVRSGNGWEHDHTNPAATRVAMAVAVVDDVARYGVDQVTALVVSHGDAEDLADRIRARLGDTEVLSGPALMGPGWTTEREYRAGDRVLLHARCGPPGGQLVNGTTATITGVDGTGLAVQTANGLEAVLTVEFVTGTRKDGTPNLSHAWARTVDGAQGGTWETCHLLGNSSLDAYRGYTGQSRARQPTHTWNTRQLVTADHGGVLADQRNPAEIVAQALARQPDPTLAACSDPWTLDRQLRDQIAEHELVLAGRPPDRCDELAVAVEELVSAQAWLANTEAIAAGATARLEDLGALTGLRRHGREQRRRLEGQLTHHVQQVGEAQTRLHDIAARVAHLEQARDDFERFERSEGWRREDLDRLRARLDDHWAEVLVRCVKADDPLAFGIDKLRRARATTAEQIRRIDATIPADRDTEWQQLRRQLPHLMKAKDEAEHTLSGSMANLDRVSRRRWGRHDHDAIAAAQADVDSHEQGLQQAHHNESGLREDLKAIAAYQQQRSQVINETRPRRQELVTSLAQLDGALDHTRPERVWALADQLPLHLTERLGPPPPSIAGRAVWCHYAMSIEAVVDRNDAARPAWAGWSRQADRAQRDIAVADRHVDVSEIGVDPSEWAALAQRASIIDAELLKHLRVRQAHEHPMTYYEANQVLGLNHPLRPLGPSL
jgi:conjugative relaxase-like TrwC/TraI family protein